jgi:hypothetical protein
LWTPAVLLVMASKERRTRRGADAQFEPPNNTEERDQQMQQTLLTAG